MAALLVFWNALLLFILPHLPSVLSANICQWEYGRCEICILFRLETLLISPIIAILANDTLFFMGGNYTFQGGGAQGSPGTSHLA